MGDHGFQLGNDMHVDERWDRSGKVGTQLGKRVPSWSAIDFGTCCSKARLRYGENVRMATRKARPGE